MSARRALSASRVKSRYLAGGAEAGAHLGQLAGDLVGLDAGLAVLGAGLVFAGDGTVPFAVQVGAFFQADALEGELLAGGVAQQQAFEDRLHHVVAAVGTGTEIPSGLADLLVLAEQHVEDDAVDAVVGAVEDDGADDAGALAEPVDAALALLVPGRVPGQVVVDDGVEVLLQVDALGQAVGGDQHRALARVAGQVADPGFPLVRRQDAGDGGDRVVGAEALGQVLGDVLGGGDEPAEDDRVVAVERAARVTVSPSSLSLASPWPSSWLARAAKRRSRRRCGVSPSAASPSAPGVASADSTVSSSGRSRTAERPSPSASASSWASRLAARVRKVAAAAPGEEASARSSASADHQRTRCRSWPPSGSRTVSRA